MKHSNISLFVPHAGCPNQCSFCNQKTISGSVKELTKEEVRRVRQLTLENIEVGYTSKLNNAFSYTVLSGDKIAILGDNGCGKTTILKAIFNHFTIKKTGQVIFNGKDITNSLPQEIAKCGIHMMQQNPETIVGLKTMDLLQALLKNQDKTKQMSDFYVKVLKRLSDLGLTNDILEREVNFN